MFMLNERGPDSLATIRNFNSATANEIAAVFVSQDGIPPSCCAKDLTIFPRTTSRNDIPRNISLDNDQIPGSNLLKISRINPNVDPMVYPILFASGDQGFRLNLPHIRNGKRNRITLREYYCFIFQHGRDIFPTLRLSGRLFQQFAVDAYTKIEGDRLQFLRNNQNKLRVDSYQGLVDHLHVDGLAITPEQEDVLFYHRASPDLLEIWPSSIKRQQLL